MRKCLILIITVFSSVMSCFGQDILLNNPENHAYFGVRCAAEVICPGEFKIGDIGVSTFKNGGGVEIGCIYNFPVIANFYVEPGVKFYYNTYSYNTYSAKNRIVNAIPDEFGNISKLSYTKYGIRVPIVAGYHFDFTEDFKVAFFTGLEVENSLSGKENYNKDGIKMSNNIYRGDDSMNRFASLWVGGCGVTYRHFYFDIHGAVGLVNLMRNHSYSFRENRLTFTLGYNF